MRAETIMASWSRSRGKRILATVEEIRCVKAHLRTKMAWSPGLQVGVFMFEGRPVERVDDRDLREQMRDWRHRAVQGVDLAS